MLLKGYAHVYGDNIDTDRIIPGKYTKTLDLNELAIHVLEDLDPNFLKVMKKGDMIVGGTNFGCGSSREQAPLALKSAGVSIVIAKSFARIFYRNAINIGLPLVEIPEHTIEQNDDLEVDLSQGIVKNLTQNVEYKISEMPKVMIQILQSGGLVNFLREKSDYVL